ncbi:MAG: (d)CMP kinase [Bacteroidales bacterium]|jgi:cytidylate kinase|nr:(d)CMP kinase [Bacteroidales bacterium]
MKRKLIIAIDGYSSCGKSTFARAIASKYGYIFIDTGAMYRAVTLYCLRKGLVGKGFVKTGNIISILPEIDINFSYNPDKEMYETYLNSENVEWEIRSVEVTANVSEISMIREVRARMVELQRQIGAFRGVVMDGRDIGTVVFPDADIKIFMTASVDIRAERRYLELKEKGVEINIDDIRNAIIERDHKDETREASPLRKAEDALVLDNTSMSVSEQMDWVSGIIEKRINEH